MTDSRSAPPPPGRLLELHPLSPERAGLANGMSVVMLRRPALPEVALRLIVPAGADAVPVEVAGLASLVAKLLPEGAAGRDGREMARWIDGLGVTVGVGVGYDAAVVRMHTLSDLLPDALDLLAAVATSPDFPDEEVARVKGERLDQVRRLRDDPDEVSTDLLAELLYGDRSYGRLARGRLRSVEAIDRDRITSFHAGRYSPGAATLVAVGDLPDDFADTVAARFGKWSGPAVTASRAEVPPAPATGGTVLVDRPGSQQSIIRIAGIGLARGDDGEPAARVMNAILGGLFNSRLNLNLREDKGWTYGARSSLGLRRSPGPITMKAAVETAVTADAVAEMWSEIDRMGETVPEDAEMVTAAGALTLSIPLQFETNTQVAGKLVEQVVYGLPDDYWSGFKATIVEVTPKDVASAASRYLARDRLVTLVVGDAEAMASDLGRLGPLLRRSAP